MNLQAQSHLRGDVFQLNPVSLPQGVWVHFDIEDNPLTGTGEKHVYLWGFLVPDYDQDNFEYVWTDNEDENQKGWLQFLAKIEEYLLFSQSGRLFAALPSATTWKTMTPCFIS